jgi:sensor histidine kinase regulating citrate/malate metabolism
MKFRVKIAILLVAVLITFVGFNTMVTASSVDKMITVGHQAGYQIIANYVAENGSVPRVSPRG